MGTWARQRWALRGAAGTHPVTLHLQQGWVVTPLNTIPCPADLFNTLCLQNPILQSDIERRTGFPSTWFCAGLHCKPKNKHRKFWLSEFFVEGVSWGESRHCAPSEGHGKHGELWALDTGGICLNSLQFASGRAVHALPDINPTWLHHLCPPSLPGPHTHLPHRFIFPWLLNPWHYPKSLHYSTLKPLQPELCPPQQPLPDVHKGAARSNKSKAALKEVSMILIPTSPLLPHCKPTAQPTLEPVRLQMCFSQKKTKQSTQKKKPN